MYIRNYKGEMVQFNWKQYLNEKELYRALWKICYNIDLKDQEATNPKLLAFIQKSK